MKFLVALGSNLGDRLANLKTAVAELRAISSSPVRKSPVYETSPVDCPPGSPLFVNAVAGFTPRQGESPESLLAKLQALEKEFGRKPKRIVNEPRPLDLDLIAFGNEVRTTPELGLPHPRAHQRRFVLQPLSEIAPGLILPAQSKTVARLLSELPLDDSIKRLTDEEAEYGA